MSEWKRNKRRTDGFPSGVEEGMVLEVKFRNGTVERRTAGHQEGIDLDWLSSAHFNTKGGTWCDIMAYRIVGYNGPEPAINTPNHSNGFPFGTTAKDIGAKVGDEFLMIDDKHQGAYHGEKVILVEDDGTTSPFFTNPRGMKRCISWLFLSPIPPKTAIELQAEEVGIAEQEWPEDRVDNIGRNGGDGLHYQIDTSPERVEIETGNVHMPTTAPAFLQSAINTLTQRGKDYDKPEGERSAAAVAVAFNAITGRNLTEAEVWLVLQLVKDVRQWQNPDRYHADSALDCVAYAALKAEALAAGSK